MSWQVTADALDPNRVKVVVPGARHGSVDIRTSGGAALCDDSNPNTQDGCQGVQGCTHVNLCTPTIAVSLSPSTLSPPNHRMAYIFATVTAHDPCNTQPPVSLTSITSSEPDDAPGFGDGNTHNDIQDANFGTPDFAFKLRAERDGNGPGRIYTVTYTVTGATGITSSASAMVKVPHMAAEKGPKEPPVGRGGR